MRLEPGYLSIVFMAASVDIFGGAHAAGDTDLGFCYDMFC
jgi:hypothetical protein